MFYAVSAIFHPYIGGHLLEKELSCFAFILEEVLRAMQAEARDFGVYSLDHVQDSFTYNQ